MTRQKPESLREWIDDLCWSIATSLTDKGVAHAQRTKKLGPCPLSLISARGKADRPLIVVMDADVALNTAVRIARGTPSQTVELADGGPLELLAPPVLLEELERRLPHMARVHELSLEKLTQAADRLLKLVRIEPEGELPPGLPEAIRDGILRLKATGDRMYYTLLLNSQADLLLAKDADYRHQGLPGVVDVDSLGVFDREVRGLIARSAVFSGYAGIMFSITRGTVNATSQGLTSLFTRAAANPLLALGALAGLHYLLTTAKPDSLVGHVLQAGREGARAFLDINVKVGSEVVQAYVVPPSADFTMLAEKRDAVQAIRDEIKKGPRCS